jgi:hypothetical protein
VHAASESEPAVPDTGCFSPSRVLLRRGGAAGADGEAAHGHVEDGEEEDDNRRGRSGAADGIGRWWRQP